MNNCKKARFDGSAKVPIDQELISQLQEENKELKSKVEDLKTENEELRKEVQALLPEAPQTQTQLQAQSSEKDSKNFIIAAMAAVIAIMVLNS